MTASRDGTTLNEAERQIARQALDDQYEANGKVDTECAVAAVEAVLRHRAAASPASPQVTTTEKQLRLQQECDVALTNLCLAVLSKQEGDLREAKRNVNAAITALVEDARHTVQTTSAPPKVSGNESYVAGFKAGWLEGNTKATGHAPSVAEQFLALGWTCKTVEEAAQALEDLSGMARVEAARRIAAEKAAQDVVAYWDSLWEVPTTDERPTEHFRDILDARINTLRDQLEASRRAAVPSPDPEGSR